MNLKELINNWLLLSHSGASLQEITVFKTEVSKQIDELQSRPKLEEMTAIREENKALERKVRILEKDYKDSKAEITALKTKLTRLEKKLEKAEA